MNEEEFATLLASGHEVTGVEFKGPGPASDKHLFALVTQAVLGMANRRDGGKVIIGVEDINGVLNPVGLTTSDLATWKYDDTAAKLAEYADPSVNFDLKPQRYKGKDYAIVYVTEFDDIPILCKQDYNKGKKVVLRKGACYVRPRRKPETTEIPTQEDMRDLLDLAAEKRLRKYLEQAKRAGAVILPLQMERLTPSPQELYDKQLGGL